LADFAKRCKVDRRLLKREATRLAKLAVEHAPAQALVDDYAEDEKAFAAQLRDFVVGQGARLTALASDAAKIEDEYL
jgi:serine/threonine-protein kinase HipA